MTHSQVGGGGGRRGWGQTPPHSLLALYLGSMSSMKAFFRSSSLFSSRSFSLGDKVSVSALYWSHTDPRNSIFFFSLFSELNAINTV